MAEYAGDKSHEPTPFRRQKAREQGQVAYSQDLGSAALLFAALLILMSLGPALIRLLADFMQHQLGGEPWLTTDRDTVLAVANGILRELAGAIGPIFGLLFATAALASVFQIGLLFTPERIAPDITRLDPLKGLQRIFSLPGVMRLSFGLFKVIVVIAVVAFGLYDRWEDIVRAASLAPIEIARFLADLALGVGLRVAGALLVLALLDYGFQRWKHEQDLRMTTQEVREELRNQQGDPQILARRRAVQRQLAMHQLANVVPKADVVVTNPTELAVAIQYLSDKMAAPIVLAKGAGVMAARIRRLALEHNVPIVEKKPLAQALFKEVDVNHPVPDKMYAAVAEVLAYVYQLKGKKGPRAMSG
jgi:flagellar biosynthetic protein FlhB